MTMVNGRCDDGDVRRLLRDETGFHRFSLSTNLPALKVNVYFTEFPVPTLIDVPPDSAPILDELGLRLSEVGYSLHDIRTIIVTHSHLDHCGSARTIADLSGADVWATDGVASWLTDYEKESLEEEEFVVSSLRMAEVPDWLIEQGREHFEIMRGFTRGVDVAHRLRVGDVLELGSCSLRVTHVPGHTPWCIMLRDEGKRLAFTGDFLLGDISPNPLIQRPSTVPEAYRSLKTYASSLKRVEAMRLRAAFPGHGELIANPGARARSLLAQMGERKGAILSAASRRPTQTVFDVVEELFPQLPPGQVFLAVSEVLSHFEVLLDEGRLEEKGRSSTRLFGLPSRVQPSQD
jgi:glyoxylase-like metal-dependent hydrolase (beta-lactamase superfamily II)